jgi:hypothetical protein
MLKRRKANQPNIMAEKKAINQPNIMAEKKAINQPNIMQSFLQKRMRHPLKIAMCANCQETFHAILVRAGVPHFIAKLF